MLLGYGGKNCWCFKEWMQVDLTLKESVPADVSMNLPATTALCFKGANAAGKTNALKVFGFIVDFARNSFNYKPESDIHFDSFFSNDEPGEFYVEFISKENFYRYEFIVSQKKVIKESLFRKWNKNGAHITKIFVRENNEVIKNSLYKSNSGIIFRDNASFISTLHQYNLPEIEDIYEFFFFVSSNVSYLGLRDGLSVNPYIIARNYATDSQMLSFVEKKIRQFDTGIEKILIKTRKDEQNNDVFYPVFIHTVESQKSEPLLYEMESSGTKALYNKLEFYYLTLKSGGVLVLDEFDINLHPDILPHLLNLFIKKENNPLNAQIIFTTHSNELMDILGRYRTYLVQKENGESFCYRLDELPAELLRNDRPISTPYRKHLIGGYPKIGTEEN